MENVTRIFGNVKSGWEKLERKKRYSLVVFIAATAVFAMLFSWYRGRVTYGVLYTNLDLEDAARIAADLENRGDIAYTLENGGRDIYIDESQLDKYRLDSAMDGLTPESSTGFEIFDDVGLMVTDEDRKIMYQRALEGELQRSLMSLSEIDSARVHLVLPDDSIFATEKKDATASVILKIKAGASLNNDVVRGIVALASGAVDNLPEENVQVIDSDGNLLSTAILEDGNLDGFDIAEKYQKVKESFEEQVQGNIESLLGPAFGQDKIKVSVYAELDFDAEEKTVISYEDPVVRSEQKSITGSGAVVSSIETEPVGNSTSNVLLSDEGEDISSYDGTVNYELTETTTNTIKAPGKVERMSSSVLYDGILTAEQKATINRLVASATGFDEERGDAISIEGVVFDTTYQEELEAELAAIQEMEENNRTFLDRYGDYIIYGIFALLAAVIAYAMLSLVKGLGKANREGALAFNIPPGTKVDILDELAGQSEKNDQGRDDQARDYAAGNPAVTADLIKAWMKN